MAENKEELNNKSDLLDKESDNGKDSKTFSGTVMDSDDLEDDFTSADNFSVTIKEDNKIREKINTSVPVWGDNNDEKNTSNKNKRYNKLKTTLKAARKTILIILSAICAVAVILYVFCLATLPEDTVANNVMVEKLDVSGLTYDEALASIKATYIFESQDITVTCQGQSYTIDGRKINLTASPEATADKAFSYGKSGNKFIDALTSMKQLISKKVIVPVAELNYDNLNEELGKFGLQIYGMLTQHQIDITDAGAVITPGKTGFDYNTDVAREEVLDAIHNEHFENIPVTLTSCPPDDITVDYVDAAIYKDPTDAYYKIENNNVEIVPEQNGRYCNREEVASLITQVHEGGEPVTVPYSVSYPNISAQSLKDKLFEVSLGSYSTDYSSSDSNRAANVARSASLINGKVLAPGEVFSYNDTVGDRTVENGFYTAKEYVNGQSVDGIGGGTCQVSSTLYSAVLYADMGIVHRENHMMSVGYLPLGQDATVAYGSVDFKFKNTSDYPIKISAYTSGGKITVSILGTQWEPAREVKLKHSTSYSDGNTIVTSKREVYSNGQLISTDNLGTSKYAPHSQN